jgi:hypothetical protein
MRMLSFVRNVTEVLSDRQSYFFPLLEGKITTQFSEYVNISRFWHTHTHTRDSHGCQISVGIPLAKHFAETRGKAERLLLLLLLLLFIFRIFCCNIHLNDIHFQHESTDVLSSLWLQSLFVGTSFEPLQPDGRYWYLYRHLPDSPCFDVRVRESSGVKKP